MSWLRFFSPRGQHEWHKLDDIVQSALADVITTDANFQLRQAEAWSQFNQSIRELGDHPLLQTLDLSVGFGRLENLALQEMSVNLDMEIYRPSFAKRTWWGLIKLFGIKPKHEDKTFRLCPPNSRRGNRMELSLKLKRNAAGTWEVDHNVAEDASELADAASTS